MKPKIYTTLFLVLGTAVITFLIVHFITPAVFKESFARWGSMPIREMTISDALALIIIVLFIVQPFKTETNDKN